MALENIEINLPSTCRNRTDLKLHSKLNSASDDDRNNENVNFEGTSPEFNSIERMRACGLRYYSVPKLKDLYNGEITCVRIFITFITVICGTSRLASEHNKSALSSMLKSAFRINALLSNYCVILLILCANLNTMHAQSICQDGTSTGCCNANSRILCNCLINETLQDRCVNNVSFDWIFDSCIFKYCIESIDQEYDQISHKIGVAAWV